MRRVKVDDHFVVMGALNNSSGFKWLKTQRNDCTWCNRSGNLSIVYRIPKIFDGNDKIDNLYLLCGICTLIRAKHVEVLQRKVLKGKLSRDEAIKEILEYVGNSLDIDRLYKSREKNIKTITTIFNRHTSLHISLGKFYLQITFHILLQTKQNQRWPRICITTSQRSK